jgi:hypothetical protein
MLNFIFVHRAVIGYDFFQQQAELWNIPLAVAQICLPARTQYSSRGDELNVAGDRFLPADHNSGRHGPTLGAPAEEPNSTTGVFLPDRFPLICCFKIADDLNEITRRCKIGTSVPVFGLRPTRCFLLRTKNDPNEESLTVSPLSKLAVISFKTSSTMMTDWARDIPAFR